MNFTSKVTFSSDFLPAAQRLSLIVEIVGVVVGKGTFGLLFVGVDVGKGTFGYFFTSFSY